MYSSYEKDLTNYLKTFNCILRTMISRMTEVVPINSVSHNFILQMIPHHEGAISMSLNTLQYDICPELKPILDAIIVSQRKGVKEMENLLKNSCSCGNNC